MKRASILFFSLLTSLLSFAQTQYGKIHVRVVDSGSNEPLPYSNVYLNQTTIGGYTNDKGEVTINKIPFGTHLLIISELGHTPYQRNITVENEELVSINIRLVVKVLDEVKVTGTRDKQWNRQLERFERLFFGAERFKYCKITNPWVLDFKVVNGDFIAEASEPLKIENEYLGYNLDFSLKNCIFTATTFSIVGNVRYEERKGDEASVKRWKENREFSYRGSPQHLFRSAINNSTNSEGFKLYTDISRKEKLTRGSTLSSNINVTVVPDSLTNKIKKTGNSQYAITIPSRLEVHYLRKRAPITAYTDIGNPITWIEVKNGPIVINGAGVVQNNDKVSFSGAMSDMRVSDWLPQNYQPSSTSSAMNGPSVVTKDLREKIYVHTDRSYYYHDETIWLKGYVNYAVPILRDTLSRAVYVELVDEYSKSVAVIKRYPVENGRFHGDIHLDRTLVPGLYQLKVYTSWMLNFEKELIFTKTIGLLNEKQSVRPALNYTPDKNLQSGISIETDKTAYSTRDKISLTIDVTDSLDFKAIADLSIAVTDINLVVPEKTGKTILTRFLFTEKYSNKVVKVKTPIEQGINFKGRLTSGNKPVAGMMKVFQSNSADTFEAITDENGRFQKNLLFNDTLDLFVKAVTTSNKKGIVVMDTSRLKAPSFPFEPLTLEVYTSNNVRRVVGVNMKEVTMLNEVSVEGKKINEAGKAAIYGAPDYTIDGEWITERNYQDIFQAIAQRVPGLNYSQSGPTVRFTAAEFGSVNSGTAPLILVDGVTMNESQVLSVPIRSIDRVDVLKFGSTASFGSRGGNGVIAIYTRTGMPKSSEQQAFDKKKMQKIRLGGFSPSTEFKPTDYSTQPADDYFDSRATIYWSPSIITDGNNPATVSFYAADSPTIYRIVIEGVTAEGVPVRAEKVIEVIKKN